MDNIIIDWNGFMSLNNMIVWPSGEVNYRYNSYLFVHDKRITISYHQGIRRNG